MQNSVAKKTFAVGLAVSTLLWAALPFVSQAAVHTDGTNVSWVDASGNTTIGMVVGGQRRPYTSAGAFTSYGFNSFASVVTASPEDAALPLGAFIPPQDGSIVCSDRGADKGTCYEVSGGQKFGFTSAAVFTGLGFSFKNAPMADVSWMAAGNSLINSTSMAHLPGTLINNNGTVQLVGATGLLGIPSLDVFNGWGYSFTKVVPANAFDTAKSQTGVMPAHLPGQLSPNWTVNPNPNPTPGPVVSGPLSVSLASDNPASGSIVSGQATADLAHFTFMGTGSLSQLTFQRIGISSNTTLNNVYLYNGGVRVADGASVNSNGVISFNGVNIAINGSTTLKVEADIAAGVSGQTIGVQLTSFTPTGGTATAASISGNLMTVASASLAAVSVQANTVSAANVNAGTVAYTFWSSPVTVSTRSVWLKGATFKYIGSAPMDAVSNWHLFVNGTSVGPVGVVNSLSNLVFDMSGAPLSMNTGASTVEVRGDVIKGSNRNVMLSLQNAADLVVTDSQLGVNVAVVSPLTSSTSFSTVPGGTITINPGTITTTIDPSFNSVTNVTGGAPGAVIGRFKLTAYGEDVKVQSLSVTPILTGMTPAASGLNNVSLFFNGSQVGSSQNWTSGALTFQLGSSMIVPAGATGSTLEVRADMQTTASANYTAGTVQVTLNIGSSNGQGQNSLNTTNVPAAAITTTGLTVTTGALGIAVNPGYANQTVNANTANVKVGSFVIQNTSTSEAVRITNLAVGLSFAAPTYQSGTVTTGSQNITFNSTTGLTAGNVITIPGATPAVGTVTSITSATVAVVNITTGGVTPTVGGAITGSGATVGPATLTNFSNLRTSETSGSGATPINPTATNNFSVNFTLATGQTKTIDVFMDGSTANMGAVTTTLLPTAVGASSNVVLTPGSATTGQVVTIASGTLAAPTLNPAPASMTAQFVVGPSSNVPVAQYNFVATNGAATITELKFTITGSAVNPITQVCVAGVCAPVVSGVAYLTGLNIAVPFNNAGANVTVTPSFAAVGQNGVVSNTTAIMTLTYMKYTIGGITTTNNSLSVAANTMTVVGTKPTITIGSSSDTLVNGLVKIMEVTVAADAAGDLKVSAIPINVSSTGVATVATGTNNVVVKGTDGVVIPTTNGTFVVPAGGTSGDVAINFTSPYLIPAGTSKTFRFYVTAATVSGATNTTSFSSKLGAASLFTWTDQVGGVSGITGALIYNYPTDTVVIHN